MRDHPILKVDKRGFYIPLTAMEKGEIGGFAGSIFMGYVENSMTFVKFGVCRVTLDQAKRAAEWGWKTVRMDGEGHSHIERNQLVYGKFKRMIDVTKLNRE